MKNKIITIIILVSVTGGFKYSAVNPGKYKGVKTLYKR